MRASHVDPAVELPAGVCCIRRARPEDAEAIAALQEHYLLRNIDAADHPANGWLVQKSTADAIRFAMRHYKDFWIAEGFGGELLAFQAVSAARFISRPPGKHKFIGPHAKRAFRTIQSGNFIYMSQIATHPELRGKGVAAALQAEVLKRYRKLPLVAHIAVFTQQDLDARDPGEPFQPRSNNVASHRYHQRQGYRLVGYTSDVATLELNTGLEPPDPKSGALPGIAGALYIHFRDGAEEVPQPYVDPVETVLSSPVKPGEVDSAEWKNPFPDHWPEPDDFDDVDPTWSQERAERYARAKERLELLFLTKPGASGARGPQDVGHPARAGARARGGERKRGRGLGPSRVPQCGPSKPQL